MKKRFSDEQKVQIVVESRAHGVPAATKKHGISEHWCTFQRNGIIINLATRWCDNLHEVIRSSGFAH